MNKKVDVIVDLQFGSTGKGLIAGYLAKMYGHDTVINANMPNAGHTFIDRRGRKWVHKVLPNGIVGENVKVVGLGPGSIFSLDQLAKEYDESADLMNDKKFIIHEGAAVLQPKHSEAERQQLSGISSTMQGSAAAMVEKIMRQGGDILARDVLKGTRFEENVVSSHDWVMQMMAAESILLEGAQGYSLGINAGFWPYCTSRDCTPTRFLADCAIPAAWLRNTVGCARVHPIRVGNTPDGYSGDCYPDQEEISWLQLGLAPEKTTVTGRDRRIFSPSAQQLTEALAACQPNMVFLNFMNYDSALGAVVQQGIDSVLKQIGPHNARVTFTGWGPTEQDIEYEEA